MLHHRAPGVDRPLQARGAGSLSIKPGVCDAPASVPAAASIARRMREAADNGSVLSGIAATGGGSSYGGVRNGCRPAVERMYRAGAGAGLRVRINPYAAPWLLEDTNTRADSGSSRCADSGTNGGADCSSADRGADGSADCRAHKAGNGGADRDLDADGDLYAGADSGQREHAVDRFNCALTAPGV